MNNADKSTGIGSVTKKLNLIKQGETGDAQEKLFRRSVNIARFPTTGVAHGEQPYEHGLM